MHVHIYHCAGLAVARNLLILGGMFFWLCVGEWRGVPGVAVTYPLPTPAFLRLASRVHLHPRGGSAGILR